MCNIDKGRGRERGKGRGREREREGEGERGRERGRGGGDVLTYIRSRSKEMIAKSRVFQCLNYFRRLL